MVGLKEKDIEINNIYVDVGDTFGGTDEDTIGGVANPIFTQLSIVNNKEDKLNILNIHLYYWIDLFDFRERENDE